MDIKICKNKREKRIRIHDENIHLVLKCIKDIIAKGESKIKTLIKIYRKE